jgi:hypothetical protein
MEERSRIKTNIAIVILIVGGSAIMSFTPQHDIGACMFIIGGLVALSKK